MDEQKENDQTSNDATADELDRARWAYSLPVVRVRLFDEAGVER